MQGRRCGSGRPLHFWLDVGGYPPDLPPAGAPAAGAQLSAAGAPDAWLNPPRPDYLRSWGPPPSSGYFLFSAPGTWQVTASQDGKVLGTIVILAPPAATPAPGGHGG